MTALLDCIQIESASNPTAAVIWLHGLGASGDDFAGLYPELDLGGCPAIRFIFPHAPQIPVTINGGYVMPAWYDILGTELGAGAIRKEDDAGIRISQGDIEALIADQVSKGIKPEHIVLAGFSQGCAMALHTGLRHKARLAGIMAHARSRGKRSQQNDTHFYGTWNARPSRRARSRRNITCKTECT
jgi:phospholipase/carboxylesterase